MGLVPETALQMCVVLMSDGSLLAICCGSMPAYTEYQFPAN
jgi:hypothetical protein